MFRTSDPSEHLRERGPDLVPVYLDNLCRLGVLEIPSGKHIPGKNVYEPLENDPKLESHKMVVVELMKRKVTFARKVVTLTTFGQQFVQNVVDNK